VDKKRRDRSGYSCGQPSAQVAPGIFIAVRSVVNRTGHRIKGNFAGQRDAVGLVDLLARQESVSITPACGNRPGRSDSATFAAP
jgi:hypothetical protein